MDGGDFVVLTQAGDDSYNDYLYNTLGGVNSVETILMDTQLTANI